MEFEKRKVAALSGMGSTETDKSPKGSIDTPIIPLLNAINSHPSFFTTSSCSGRITILSHPISPSPAAAKSKKARGGSWLFVSHYPADPDSVVSLLFPPPSLSPSTQQQSLPHCDLVFRFEPLIVAVECLHVPAAQSLLSVAISSGFRESGITSAAKRVIVAIRCSIRMEVPLGDTTRPLMVSPEFVRYLVAVANEKMEANRRRTEAFLQALRCNGFSLSQSVSEPEPELGRDDKIHKNDSTCNVAHVYGRSRAEDQPAPSETERADDDDEAYLGSSEYLGCSLSTTQMVIFGEPLDKLSLWGHSACNLDDPSGEKILVFGGFGGMGRHSRRNDCLLLDTMRGTLKTIMTIGPPPPRMGHTSSLVGNSMFVIGGRADPTKILNEVWVLNANNNEWKLLNCAGCLFPPRHRHAAAVIGSKVYVFGGLTDDVISSSLYVLDTDTLQWNEIGIKGNWPCARHSHSLVSYGSQLFMFGGYDGEKPLGDLYIFDIKTCSWKKEMMAGKVPYARFSHSMFVYKHYLGIIGGCPVKQHCQELALLDMQLCMWKHLILGSASKDLFVRSTANVVGSHLVVIGGGASCYAFGTTFNKPVKVNLLSVVSCNDNIMALASGAEHVSPDQQEAAALKSPESPDLNIHSELPASNVGPHEVTSHWVLQVTKRYAKLVKDILKSFGWLDIVRKVHSQEDGMHICFPITEKFSTIFSGMQHKLDAHEGLKDHLLKPYKTEWVSSNKVSSLTALSILIECGASKVPDSVFLVKRTPNSPLKLMSKAVASLIKDRGLPEQLLQQLPMRWDKLGDIVVLPVTSFKDPVWESVGKELWPIVAKSLNAGRLARQGRVAPNGRRDSSLEILVGDNGWVEHRENGILYSFEATKCMFSWGNLSEKLRMAHLACRNEVIVDLFAGIGYFVLPFLVRAEAKLVYACEWNPHAIKALQHNLNANSVAHLCVILEGDNRLTAPKGVADRVCLGLLPTSEGSWVTAVQALRADGGVLHVHGNVKDAEEVSWTEHVAKSIHEIAKSEGHFWEVSIEHVERVKWYAPHIRHLVADVRCRKT